MDFHAWMVIGVLTLAAYANGLALYWIAQRQWKVKKSRFWWVVATAVLLHAVLFVLTGGQPVPHLLVVLPGLAVLVSAWVQRRG
jgi:hypothetical protein